ncbi:hypothetical protein Ddye_018101 [Dipteronia dyeriana]|uniref:CTLH domain-containing protein n=1 Tax=Dipteronia dyeriana TaxID=168575 RepID=A0AAD9X1P8_9ROSI|nr:hypothetical protein Ddye_018101 [Dipteronia dyeriana]
MNHFGEAIMSGEWEKADKYLSAFTKLADNRHSKKLFFELHKQKYFEALDREDHALAINIFENELKLFSVVTLAELLALKDLRHDSISCTLKNERQLSSYMNVTSTRDEFRDFLKQMIKRNPILQDKLEFPSVEESALLSLINLICPKNAKMTRSVKEELIYLILQFLDEENFKETLHKLELETKVYFDIDYFVECMINRNWDRAEKYLSAFTKMDDNRYSMDVFSRIQKLKHFEAVDSRRQEKHPSNPEKGHECEATILKMLLEENPILQEKLKFPSIDKSRLKKLIKKAMDWWIPHFAYMKHNASNLAISLKGIPTVPDLFHAPASVKIESSHEGRSSPALNGDGVPKNR